MSTKKITLIITLLMICLCAISSFAANYSEALAKAIYFYEAQQAGPLGSFNRVPWRANATMSDGVLGGWYDAGDHVKFNLPMAYSASMLGWASYEYGKNTDLDNNLKFVLDYLAACAGSSYVYQVGDGNADHGWWGPVEVIHKETGAGNRPTYSSASNLSAVMAQTAAALAIGYKLYGTSTYLTKAQSLFTKADTDRSDANYTAANSFYNSWSGPIDELQWAAIWLYIATNTASYLTKAEGYTSLLNKQGQTSDIEYQWGHCWDDSHYGGLLMLAKLTGKAEYLNFVHLHLDWWVAGAKGKTPKGLSWLDTWGSLRYASTAAFLAFVYADWTGGDSARRTSYRTWATSQIDYILGNNERNGSYVVGFGTSPPQHPHHRTAHGSWADSQSVPPNHRHVLYGALVGGPSQTGAYTDEIGNYQTNEVACDYNAGFVGALKALASPASFTPPAETKDDEFFVEAKINSSGPNYTEIKALCNNRSGWPARLVTNLRFRYFLDLSELFAAGYTASNVTVTTNYVEFPVTITGPTQFSGDIYYVQVAFTDGTSIYPGGQSEYSAEVQFRMAAPTGTTFWNANNDYSYTGLNSTSDTKTTYIPVYDGTTKLFGNEPSGGSSTTPPSETAAPTTPPADTPVPTTPPVDTPAPTTPPSETAAPTDTPGPTAIPTATPAGTPIPTDPPADTPAPTNPPSDTTAPTNPPADTAAPTNPPATGCTCANLCSSQTAITVPFTKDGAGEFCYTSSSLATYVNSWNCDVVNVNGTDCTNVYASSSSIPAIGGVYYIYFKGSYSWAHLEIK